MHLQYKEIVPYFCQVALSFILEGVLNKQLKVSTDAWPFMKPVNKKVVKDYYNVIKHPMDLETIGKKVQGLFDFFYLFSQYFSQNFILLP